MECKVDKVRTGRQGVMNGCWEDNNRTEWRGKELRKEVMRVTEDGGQEQG